MPRILFPVPKVMKLPIAARRRFGPLTTEASGNCCCSVSGVVISGVGVDVGVGVGIGVGVGLRVGAGVGVGVGTALIV